MPRRRLRLVCSSDEEDDQPQSQHRESQAHPLEVEGSDDDIEIELQQSTLDFQTVTLNSSSSNPNNNADPSEPEPLEISDDDDNFIDVSDNLSDPSPPPAPPPPPQPSFPAPSFQSSTASTTGNNNFIYSEDASDCPISGILRGLGLRLRREWLDSCIRALDSSSPGFASFDDSRKAKLCFENFLYSDMNYTGAGVLPAGVHDVHLVDLPGPFVLQVDEIVNISVSLKDRYQNANSGYKRCLKLSMTDGVQRVFGMEYRPIKDLEVLAPAGLKVAICNVSVRHGLLMLVPEVFQVLGGLVEELDAARQRVVEEVNKPPRGKRTRTGVVPPLANRATLAAWPPDNFGVTENMAGSASQVAAPSQADGEGTRLGVSTSARTMEEPAVPINCADTEPNPSSNAVSNVEEIHMVDEVEHPFILTGDREIPFTYLASLSAQWAAVKDRTPNVQGQIKCFLTGVKSFQYKQRTTFELRVYIDDGSLISEILIDHNVVQKGIGYSPEEVSSALASSDAKRITGMKETLKQFQSFLVNFEGIMLVEMNVASSVPIAIEMCQGSPASDAWLLLRRLKSFFSAQIPQQPQADPIDILP